MFYPSNRETQVKGYYFEKINVIRELLVVNDEPVIEPDIEKFRFVTKGKFIPVALIYEAPHGNTATGVKLSKIER